MMMHLRFFFLVGALLLSSVSAGRRAVCNPLNCIEGTCVGHKCQCDPGFMGYDCSIPFKTCEDGDRTCFNGSECVRNNERDPVTNKYKYHCDCSEAFGLSSFAGEQCEYSATSVCEEDTAVSELAFCVNGGTCLSIVKKGRDHPGCQCQDAFEGLHCQYLYGNAPPEELAAVAYLKSRGGKPDGLSSIALVFIIVIPMIVMGMLAYMIYKKRSASKEEAPIENAELEIQVPAGEKESVATEAEIL